MRNVNINLKISFSENGTSGFTLKDTTGIGFMKFMPEQSGVSTEYYRTSDVLFLDLVSYNKISDNKLTGFKYLVKSDEGYNNYKFDYLSEIDGWFTIDHIILPTLNYMRNFLTPAGKETRPTKELETFYDGAYIVYDSDNDTYLQLEVLNGTYTQSKIDLYYIKEHLTNINLIGIEEQLFLIGHLEKCYEDMIKYILYNNLFEACIYKDSDLNNLYRNRDIVWMALELIKRLINQCKFFEAQRLLERISTCNTFCTKSLGKLNLKFKTGGCNCK